MTNNNRTFHEVFVKQLEIVLTPYAGERVTRDKAMRIYNDIYGSLHQMFSLAKETMRLGPDGTNWLAQCYYDGIQLKTTSQTIEFLPDDIFTKRPKLEDLPSRDLVILFALTRKTGFQAEVIEVLRKR